MSETFYRDLDLLFCVTLFTLELCPANSRPFVSHRIACFIYSVQKVHWTSLTSLFLSFLEIFSHKLVQIHSSTEEEEALKCIISSVLKLFHEFHPLLFPEGWWIQSLLHHDGNPLIFIQIWSFAQNLLTYLFARVQTSIILFTV